MPSIFGGLGNLAVLVIKYVTTNQLKVIKIFKSKIYLYNYLFYTFIVKVSYI